jgi:hypothetical protein
VKNEILEYSQYRIGAWWDKHHQRDRGETAAVVVAERSGHRANFKSAESGQYVDDDYPNIRLRKSVMKASSPAREDVFKAEAGTVSNFRRIVLGDFYAHIDLE